MKGALEADHIPVNKFDLLVLGLPPLTITELSGIEDELENVVLPDRTVASGGNRGPVEFTISMPSWHTIEQAAMELWFKESQDPVVPTYKKAATLTMKSIGGTPKAFALIDLFPTKRSTPDLEMENEGEPAMIEWELKASDMQPLL